MEPQQSQNQMETDKSQLPMNQVESLEMTPYLNHSFKLKNHTTLNHSIKLKGEKNTRTTPTKTPLYESQHETENK